MQCTEVAFATCCDKSFFSNQLRQRAHSARALIVGCRAAAWWCKCCLVQRVQSEPPHTIWSHWGQYVYIKRWPIREDHLSAFAADQNLCLISHIFAFTGWTKIIVKKRKEDEKRRLRLLISKTLLPHHLFTLSLLSVCVWLVQNVFPKQSKMTIHWLLPQIKTFDQQNLVSATLFYSTSTGWLCLVGPEVFPNNQRLPFISFFPRSKLLISKT